MRESLEAVLWLLVLVSWAYWCLVWAGMAVFGRRRRAPPGFAPPVSVLKPIKGLDADAYENLRTFCVQDYPEYEVLAGVAERDDPAAGLVERLQREFPEVRIRLVVAPPTARNPKSSTLEELSRHAAHEVLVASDSDIRVTSDYLRRVVAPLGDPETGLVTCPYRSVAARSLPARLESLYLDTSFVPSAIASGTLFRTRFGLGATLAMRARDLARIGGYRAIGDLLSDDYHIARRIHRLGYRIVLSRYVVANVLGATNWSELWHREVRWLRAIRRLRPLEYPGLVLTFSTPLAILLVLATGFAPLAAAALAGSLVVRWLVSWRALSVLGHREATASLPWLPVSDLMSVALWCGAAWGRRVVWRGRVLALEAGDRIAPVSPERARVRSALGALVRRLDGLLRRRLGIYEFSEHPDCVLRVSVSRADRDITLEDGTQVREGEPIGDLHYWNERLFPPGQRQAGLGWGRALNRRLDRSLNELARHFEASRDLDGVRAVRASFTLRARHGRARAERLGRRLAMEVREPRPRGFLGRLHAFGSDVLLWLLIAAFDARRLEGWRLGRKRWELWVSRAALLDRLAGGATARGADRGSRPPGRATGTAPRPRNARLRSDRAALSGVLPDPGGRASAAFRWSVVALVHIAALIAAACTQLELVWIEVAGIASAAALLAVVALQRRWERLATATSAALQLALFATGTTAVTSLLARAARPLVDSALLDLDEFVGFQVPAIIAWMERHPAIDAVLAFAYHSILAQTLLTIFVLAWREKSQHLNALLVRLMVAALVILPVFAAFPAAGPFTGYGFEPSASNGRYLEHFNALRTGASPEIRFFIVEGLVTFPSYHAAWAVLLAAASRSVPVLHAVSLPLSALVVASTVTTGSHYAVDVAAGLVLGALAVWLVRPRGEKRGERSEKREARQEASSSSSHSSLLAPHSSRRGEE